MRKLEELLQDYIVCSNDMNGLRFYSIAHLDDSINQEKISQKEISQEKIDENEILKESILKKLKNNTYKVSDIYNLLSEGKITAAEIVKHTSIEVYDMLMDELKDFDKKNKNDNDKITGKGSENSEEILLEMSKKVMDFLTDAKEILVIKK